MKSIKPINFLTFMILFLVVLKFISHMPGRSERKFELNVPLRKAPPRIFCFILTQSSSIATKAKAVYNAWVHKCDNYKFVLKFPANLTKNNEILNFAMSMKNESIELNDLVEPMAFGEDKYKVLTTKVYLTLVHLYRKYNYYDWYLKADDDTFVFVDNLRQFLADKDPAQPITYGYNFKTIVEKGYHSGGAGYLLSNEALARIGSKLNSNMTFCRNTGTEDVDVARCLRLLGVYPGNSTDELGRERFHPLSFHGSFFGYFPDWLFKYALNAPQKVNMLI
jgi:glycoprotein-N-acetylgalactosamine 3-beta-galactosyltransferase